MTHITLPSGEWLLVKVPGWCEIVEMTFGGDKIVCWSPDMCSGNIDLPPGSYQLHGSDPLNLTEDECREIVDFYIHYFGVDDSTEEYYKDYSDVQQIVRSDYSLEWSTESYTSLLAAHGHKVGECVTLKKVK